MIVNRLLFGRTIINKVIGEMSELDPLDVAPPSPPKHK